MYLSIKNNIGQLFNKGIVDMKVVKLIKYLKAMLSSSENTSKSVNEQDLQ